MFVSANNFMSAVECTELLDVYQQSFAILCRQLSILCITNSAVQLVKQFTTPSSTNWTDTLIVFLSWECPVFAITEC